jgi:hypothetical protein
LEIRRRRRGEELGDHEDRVADLPQDRETSFSLLGPLEIRPDPRPLLIGTGGGWGKARTLADAVVALFTQSPAAR